MGCRKHQDCSKRMRMSYRIVQYFYADRRPFRFPFLLIRVTKQRTIYLYPADTLVTEQVYHRNVTLIGESLDSSRNRVTDSLSLPSNLASPNIIT